MMLNRTVLAAAGWLLLTLPVAGQECPTRDTGWEAREAVVRKAPTCRDALKTAESCAFGASGDIGLTDIVIERCEADFLTGLGKAQRARYDAGMKRCSRKHRRQDGTMYRSMEAFCQATLARDTAAKFAKAPPRR
jgi:hypothetical protein